MSLHLSKCHIVENHMSWLNCVFLPAIVMVVLISQSLAELDAKVRLTLCILMDFPIHIDTIWACRLCTLRGHR